MQKAAKKLPDCDDYAQLYQEFNWSVPERFNIAEVCARRWAANPDQIAIRHEDEAGLTRTLSYTALQTQANQLSNLLSLQGIQRGDVVAYVLPQRPEAAITLIAILQMGAIAMPLSQLFGPDALEYRLQHSQARAIIIDRSVWDQFAVIAARCKELKTCICVDHEDLDEDLPALGWTHYVPEMPGEFEQTDTCSSDPAILIYTSGTTGDPKGALLPHSALIGNLPGFVASQNWFPQQRDVFWSPADWAWTGGLMDALLPTLYFGKTIVAWQGRFSAKKAFQLLEKYRVTNTFLFPTALKQMMKTFPQPRTQFRLRLRALMCAGEPLGETVFHWCQQALGLTPNEMYGQTEMNYIVGNSHQRWPARPGSIGRPYPGHRVALIDEDGQPVPTGLPGEIAVHRRDIQGAPDPVFFLGYWKNEAATRQKYSGEWCRTGDLAVMDEDGYLWYQGRSDDMFKSAGYRIGPAEIENCLLKHPAVTNAAVVPKPDKERGNLVKAYIVVSPGYSANNGLISELQQFVKKLLAPYEYPKEIEFLDALPMTTTGKVQRRVLRLQEIERAKASG